MLTSNPETKQQAAIPDIVPQPRQLRLAVRVAIDAYEKTGKMVDAALTYAAHGFPIFPLTADKKPIPARDRDANGKAIPGTGSFKKASTDPIVIRKWWRNNPKALIGLPMGAASGLPTSTPARITPTA
jgi:Bifunctional DNA primase/polymerase, N-terminal